MLIHAITYNSEGLLAFKHVYELRKYECLLRRTYICWKSFEILSTKFQQLFYIKIVENKTSMHGVIKQKKSNGDSFKIIYCFIFTKNKIVLLS